MELPLHPNSPDTAGAMMGMNRARNDEVVCRMKIAATGTSQPGAAFVIQGLLVFTGYSERTLQRYSNPKKSAAWFRRRSLNIIATNSHFYFCIKLTLPVLATHLPRSTTCCDFPLS